jgi:hypothetical protein
MVFKNDQLLIRSLCMLRFLEPLSQCDPSDHNGRSTPSFVVTTLPS